MVKPAKSTHSAAEPDTSAFVCLSLASLCFSLLLFASLCLSLLVFGSRRHPTGGIGLESGRLTPVEEPPNRVVQDGKRYPYRRIRFIDRNIGILDLLPFNGEAMR
jgi:hypothetical protein